jgi:hypothetical protein
MTAGGSGRVGEGRDAGAAVGGVLGGCGGGGGGGGGGVGRDAGAAVDASQSTVTTGDFDTAAVYDVTFTVQAPPLPPY